MQDRGGIWQVSGHLHKEVLDYQLFTIFPVAGSPAKAGHPYASRSIPLVHLS